MAMKKTGSRRLFLLLLCGFMLFVSACSPTTENSGNNSGSSNSTGDHEVSNDTPVYSISDYLPLEAGSQWDYLGEGNEYASYKLKVLYREGDLAQLSRDNGGTVMALIYKIEADRILQVYSREDFYEDTNILDTPADEAEVILQAPFTVGASWEATDRTYTITATDETITVPAGVFDHCLKIVSTFPDSSHTVTEYYAPGTGMIRSEFKDGEAEVTSSLQ
ncbi:MAG TPA: hypothetical protein PKN87_01440 [Syntrophomonadaceae bacterium]|nr:hypothetical protein [Syntrophomonadaceae bacterium]HPR93376.1 hypothetical protein [Syntrophomonadaceae bacterium]